MSLNFLSACIKCGLSCGRAYELPDGFYCLCEVCRLTSWDISGSLRNEKYINSDLKKQLEFYKQGFKMLREMLQRCDD